MSEKCIFEVIPRVIKVACYAVPRSRRQTAVLGLLALCAVLYVMKGKGMSEPGWAHTARDMKVRERLTSELNTSSGSMRAVPVLLVTYLRSGSSWLGEITMQPEGTFYVFEPLKFFIHQGYYQIGNICFNNGTCRRPLSETETHAFAVESLKKIYKCEFEDLHPLLLHPMKQHLNITMSQDELQKQCLTATRVIVKTIRLSMAVVETLMNRLPTLQIVHLVRDPRGITCSRIRTKKRAVNVEPMALDTCNRMTSDVRLGNKLGQLCPDRVAMVMYEAMTEDPEGAAQFLYKFLNMEFSPVIKAWLYNHSHAEQYNGYYGTERTDSAARASLWRHWLSYSDVQIIDRACAGLYATLGYLPMANEQSMTNKSEKARSPLKQNGIVYSFN